MEKAAKLKYGKDLTHKEIAEELELSKSTIDNYFQESQMKNFERIFTDKERFELQRTLEQRLYDIRNEAEEKIRQGANHPEATPADRIRAGKEILNNYRREVELLQELGVIQKPKERKEIEDKTSRKEDELVDRMRDAYQELKQEEVEQDGS